MAYYPFGPLAPDLNPRLNDKTLRVADGVYPAPDGYVPVGQWTQVYSTLGAEPKGGASFITQLGNTVIIAGTATTLYRAWGSGWQAIATGYSIQSGQRWRFAQFGGVALATNGADPMQKIDLDTMAVSDLGGDPPKFETLAVVYDGFVVGSCMDGDVMSLAWSAAYNSGQWTAGSGQSDYQTLAAGGRITGIFSGYSGLILQRNRLTLMQYVGGNKIFDFQPVSENIGCVSEHSTAQWGRIGFFLSDQGFVMWNGTDPVPIGRGWVDKEFQAAYSLSDWESMSTAIDPARGVVMWSMSDKTYVYDWNDSTPEKQRWSTITYASSVIFSGVTKAISIDETDPAVGALDDDIDGVGLLSFDDASFRGGDPRLYVFRSSDDALGAFTGTPMAATFTLNDLEQFRGRRANLRHARPDVDATSGLTLSIASKQRLGDTGSTTTASTLQASGDMPIRASGRYNRPSLAIAAGTTWTHAKGIELVGEPGAGR